MTNKLETFISERIAEDEADQLRIIKFKHSTVDDRMNAARWLDECATKRWILDFYDGASRSGEEGASAAWATLTPVLLKLAGRWYRHPDYDTSWTTPDEPETFAERRSRQSVEYASARFGA